MCIRDSLYIVFFKELKSSLKDLLIL